MSSLENVRSCVWMFAHIEKSIRKRRNIMKNLKFSLLVVVLLAGGAASGDYLKMDPPPDVDKADHSHGNKPTCWVAAGSNLLAGAGYGDGNNVQERADDIYMELCNHLVDCNQCGWDDTAITTWRDSKFNTWKNTNPYNSVVVRGNRNPRPPYKVTNLPEVVGDNLRKCNLLSLSIRKPTGGGGSGGHSVATWGDSGEDVNDINVNPAKVKISDSDYWIISEAVQTYTYDDYNNPNPGDCNEGVGWYFNYSNKPHWYIDGYTMLQPTESNTPATRTLVTSAKFTYNGNDPCALDLHYKISSNKQILSYRTSIDRDTNHLPTFWEDSNWVNVSWDLNDNPVPKGSIITATAEIVVPYDANGNTISINNIYWTPMLLQPGPGMWGWGRHQELAGGSGIYPAPNMCGGYVVCALMIFGDSMGTIPVAEYFYQFDYDYYQSPEQHTITFQREPGTGTYYMGFFRFGHSYGLLTDEELQQFYDWKNVEYPGPPFPLLQPRTFVLNWAGQLPYPQGQDLINPEPNECGDPGTFYYAGDLNKDCRVDLFDMAMFCGDWLGCTEPNRVNCP